MHGTGLREGENRRSPGRSYSQHMRTVPPSATTNRTIAAAGDHSAVVTSTISTSFTTSDSFFKDGRKISIGDCALFKPPQDSPPFIGIIRWLAVSKEKKLQIGVNWLYRPAEVKLGKGIQLDASPNEIFYSFHQDEIPAASLLHPCKVSFLPEGAELPAGISSFICRRVYDIENNCLWWLSDQDYLNERQEEVDQLLDKTQKEMHATMQSGGPSPKPTNVTTSTLQSKSSPENGQVGSTFSPQVKGKKRERGDQGAGAIKRERLSKTDDCDSGIYRAENNLKSEIVKMTGKGGLVDLEGVQKFVHLMQPEKVDKKMALINRSLLAGVLASTDKLDCLNRFIQLGGLTVLDEWLLDIHKGKINDGNSSKDGDKSVEEFLLVLLRALDKLPVNLQALQMCNIGRSVNNLRSHKNLEIQKKARSLVDTWKKRVEAEIDGKSGSTQAVSTQAASSWASKSHLSEASHGGSKTSNGSDVAMKSSITLPSGSKTSSVKSSHGENRTKSSSSSPGPIKSSSSSPASGKDIQPKISGCSASDVHPSREDKSSSSVQSHSFNPSLVNDEGKGSGGSVNASKISGSGSRHRKSVNAFLGTPVTGGVKETCSIRSSLHKNTALEKSSPSAVNADNSLEAPISEGSCHKLIVKLPNRGRAPSQSAYIGSSEDPSNMSSRASSPVHSEKDDQIDPNPKGKSDAHLSNFTSDVNMDSWQSNESKDVLTGSDEAAGSPVAAALPCEEQSMTTEVSRRISEASKRNEMKLIDASFRHMNALIESCVKYSKENSSVPLDDAIGMNLLASVAAGEISRSDLISSTDSPERSPPVVDEVCTHANTKLSSPDNPIAGDESPCSDVVDGDRKNQAEAATSLSEEMLHMSKDTSLEHSGQRRYASSESNEHLLTLERIEPVNLACMGKKSSADPQGGVCEKFGEMNSSALLPSGMVEKMGDGELRNLSFDKKAVSTSVNGDAILDCKPSVNNNLVAEDMISHSLSNIEGRNQAAVVVSSYQSCDDDSKNDVKEVLGTGVQVDHELPANTATSVLTDRRDDEKLQSTGSERNLISENDNKVNVEVKGNEKDPTNIIDKFETQNFDKGEDRPSAEDQDLNCLGSTIDETKSQNIEGSVQNKESAEHQSGASSPQKDSPAIYSEEAQEVTELKETKLPGVEAADETEECASSLAEVSSSSAEPSEPDTKMKFDLNEGFIGDDGKYGEPVDFLAPGSTGVHVINPLPSAVSSVASGLPASIKVAAAAKGHFVPAEDLLRSKSELGWKGSASTSAFRPAEPRKSLEMPFGSTNVSYSDASNGRHVRPLLDIDLNVADERVHEDTASRNLAGNSDSNYASDHVVSQNECIGAMPARGSGALNLDLNRVDETDEMGQCSSSSNFKLESLIVPIDSSGGLPIGCVRRDFDLNDGPLVDDASAGQFTSYLGKGGMLSQLPTAGPRMNNLELGNFPSWFPSGNTYSTVTIPSMLPDRGNQQLPVIPPGVPQRMFAPSGGTPFPLDVYRGPVLSSSPAIPLPSSSFQHPLFPFGTAFPLPSSTFSVGTTSYVDSSPGGRLFAAPMNSQFLGHVGAVSSQFPRPYLVSFPDVTSNGGLNNNRKWGRTGLDLNSGPGAVDMEAREEMFPLTSTQLSVTSSQALTEEQARILSVSGGGILKRKEPEGGWDNESSRYKQSSWQ